MGTRQRGGSLKKYVLVSNLFAEIWDGNGILDIYLKREQYNRTLEGDTRERL